MSEVRERVWIELDKPRDETHAKELCRLANNLLLRLVEPGDVIGGFSFKDGKFYYGDAMGAWELADRGHWFNLSYLGR
jgi:hypothetical protein